MTQNLPNKAHIMAELSAAAYQEPDIAKRIFQQFNFNDYKFISRHGAQCYVIWRETDIVIIFRGTEPKEISDIFADLKAWPRGSMTNGLVHAGFKGEVDKLWDAINNHQQKHQDKKFYITGHSLGCLLYTSPSPRDRG